MRPSKPRPNILTLEQAVEMVRAYHLRGESQPSLARRYGTSPGYVSRVVRGLAWRAAYDIVELEERATTGEGAIGAGQA
jgi:hypothetical protein